MTSVEEVKSRLDIIDVISEYVPLKPAGANWRARCPFHEEKSPSFMVSKPKQMWHCFGCGEGGDVFTFVMKKEGLDFPEALQVLAAKAGVQIKTEAPQVRSEREQLLKIMDLATSFWASVLWNASEAKAAREYLQNERHLMPETIREWQVGFAPETWEALVVALGKRGVSEGDMIKAGVAVRKMTLKGRSAYDRFRNRIMFPINDVHGRPVGATGRIMPGSGDGRPAYRQAGASPSNEAKYVNTPESTIFHKGSVLFGLDRATEDIRKQNVAVIVEGNVDVLASHQAGVKNIVASSGTALTLEQCQLLRRYTDRLAFAFDTDAAGEAATLRGLATSLGAGFSVLLIELPKKADGTRYKDPDDCIRESPDLWHEAIAKAEPILDRYLRRAAEEHDLKNLAEKQAVVRTLLPVIMKLPDAVAEAHYIKRLSELVGVPEARLREAAEPRDKNKIADRAVAPSSKPSGSAQAPRDQLTIVSEQLLAGLLKEPKHLAFVVESITPEMVTQNLAPLYRDMIVYYTENQQNNRASWSDEAFRGRLRELPDGTHHIYTLDVLTLLADKEFFQLAPAEFERELLAIVRRLRLYHLKATLRELESSIREAERVHDSARLAVLLKDFHAKSADLLHLDQS